LENSNTLLRLQVLGENELTEKDKKVYERLKELAKDTNHGFVDKFFQKLFTEYMKKAHERSERQRLADTFGSKKRSPKAKDSEANLSFPNVI
jgi:isopropylmalate/homocitrate/citramalate synthase